jgi:hypothetical protein
LRGEAYSLPPIRGFPEIGFVPLESDRQRQSVISLNERNKFLADG